MINKYIYLKQIDFQFHEITWYAKWKCWHWTVSTPQSPHFLYFHIATTTNNMHCQLCRKTTTTTTTTTHPPLSESLRLTIPALATRKYLHGKLHVSTIIIIITILISIIDSSGRTSTSEHEPFDGCGVIINLEEWRRITSEDDASTTINNNSNNNNTRCMEWYPFDWIRVRTDTTGTSRTGPIPVAVFLEEPRRYGTPPQCGSHKETSDTRSYPWWWW